MVERTLGKGEVESPILSSGTFFSMHPVVHSKNHCAVSSIMPLFHTPLFKEVDFSHMLDYDQTMIYR